MCNLAHTPRMDKKRLNIWVSKSENSGLAKLVEKDRRTIQEVVRKAIQNYLRLRGAA